MPQKSILHAADPEERAIPSSGIFNAINVPGSVDPSWILIEEGFTLAREHEVESLFTLSNGYVGTRGSVAEGTSLSSPATFLAGVYEAIDPSAGSLELANLPDWTQLEILVEGLPLSLESGKILEHRRVLDLRHGLLLRRWRHQDRTGRVTGLQFLRLVLLHDRHLFVQSVGVTPENYAGTIAIECSWEHLPGGTVWRPKIDGEAVLMEGATTRGATIAMAHRSEVRLEAGPAVKRTTDIQHNGILERWAWPAKMGEAAKFTRFAAVYSSRETNDPAVPVSRHLQRAYEAGLEAHLAPHISAWEDRWRATGLEVTGDDSAQQALRFASYHLNGAVNPNDDHVSVGARGLTGSVYKGHVFWDTEIYLLPFYTFTHPAAARALLMYRFHTLPAARNRARSFGYQGALYAWESADTGEDVTPASVVAPNGEVVQVLTGMQEHHISADISYAIWQYWQATADEPFFMTAGIDILVETARFWASRGRVEQDGRYHIRTVIGPDEYHESVDDNAFTNVMAQWNLERAAEAVQWIRSSRPDVWRTVAGRLQIKPDEPAAWRRIAGVMATGFDPRTNLFEQFAGFFRLDEVDLDAYRARTVPIDIILGRERTQRSKVVKQPDVIALSALLWDRFPFAVHEANYRYYEPRTAHGSSLSPSVHALVAARLGDADLAAQYFRQAAEVDLADHMGNAAGGVHMANLGGLWQAAVFGIAGIRLRDDGLIVDPHLPTTWHEWSFRLQWRGRKLALVINREPGQVTVDLQTGGPMTIELGKDMIKQLEPGHRYIARRLGSRWSEWEESRRERQAQQEGEP